MKKCRSRIRFACMTVMILVMMFAMSVQVSAATPKLNYYQKSIYLGKSLQLNASGGTVQSWTSSDSSIVSVNGRGVVTGHKIGTAKIYAKFSTKTLNCTVNVRPVNKSKYITNSQMKVMLNVLGAVETGGQIYGHRDYTDFTSPYTNSGAEYSCTAGAYQEYGENLRQLLLKIQREYPRTFKRYDTAGIAADLQKNWYYNPYTVRKGSAKANAIVKIISSPSGKLVQDYRAMELIDEYIGHAKGLGITNVRAALFAAECEHQGGYSAMRRIVLRASNKNSISSLYTSLTQDPPNSNHIGALKYRTRHRLCRDWIAAHISKTAKLK